jgi:hypothetical protein
MIYLLEAENGYSYSDANSWVEVVLKHNSPDMNLEKLKAQALDAGVEMNPNGDYGYYWDAEAIQKLADYLIDNHGFRKLEFKC